MLGNESVTLGESVLLIGDFRNSAGSANKFQGVRVDVGAWGGENENSIGKDKVKDERPQFFVG